MEPAGRRYKAGLEQDLALLHLAGLSTRTLAQVSQHVLGVLVSPQEVSNALKELVPRAKDHRDAWAMVFAMLKERGPDGSAVQLGIMDGLPGLCDAFLEAFPRARVALLDAQSAQRVPAGASSLSCRVQERLAWPPSPP